MVLEKVLCYELTSIDGTIHLYLSFAPSNSGSKIAAVFEFHVPKRGQRQQWYKVILYLALI